MSTAARADGLGSIMTLISLACCPSQTRTVRVYWSMSAMALDLHVGPALRSATLYSPKANANACPGVPHSFRPASQPV